MIPLLPLLLPAALGAPPGSSAHAAHARLAAEGRFPLFAEPGIREPMAGPPSHPPPSQRPDKVVYGYLPYWTIQPADVPWEHLTHLAVFSVGLNANGSLYALSSWTDVAADAVALGHAAGVKVHLCVTSFDGDTIDSVLSSPSTRATTVNALAAQVDAYGADGVNIDFEGMHASQIGTLVDFVKELKARVDEVWLATPAVDWSQAYDYPELAAASDGLFIMGYAYHYTGGSAGPNAPLAAGDTWSQWSLAWSVDDYLSTGVDPAKIVLGLPLYGQEWPVADATDVPADTTNDGWSVVYTEAVADAPRYGRNYDAESDTPWYAASSTRQAWYDDSDSLAIKMGWAIETQGLAGVGFWAIGYDGSDPAFWDAVDAVSHDPQDTGTSDDTDPPEDTDTPADTDNRPGRAHVLEDEGGCGCQGSLPVGSGGAGVFTGVGLALIVGRRRR